MFVKTKARILSAESKPYTFDGREGTSHKIRVLVGDRIFPCKATADLVLAAVKLEGKDAEVELEFTSVKELVGVSFVKFAV